MTGYALVMPIAGLGSRFAEGGATLPKPLQNLWGRPFFWWAAESARRVFAPVELMFVVLREHVEHFAMCERIRAEYPIARFAVIDQVTSGAAETARIGVEQLHHDGPLIINDTDHAFVCDGAAARPSGNALLTFKADDPAYSYVKLGDAGQVVGTVEKQVVGSDAIAGAYLFASARDYIDAYDRYQNTCPYDETFVSGLYDCLITAGKPVSHYRLQEHLSFGTPGELLALGDAPSGPWRDWR